MTVKTTTMMGLEFLALGFGAGGAGWRGIGPVATGFGGAGAGVTGAE